MAQAQAQSAAARLADRAIHTSTPSHARNGGDGTTLAESPRTTASTVHSTDRLIVGVDFGTTFSGVAAVYSAAPDDVEIIKTWPGGNGITSDKVPTEISYENIGPRIPERISSALPDRRNSSSPRLRYSGSNGSPVATTPPPLPATPSYKAPAASPRWGFQLGPQDARIRCIKLFLDRTQKLPHFVSPIDTAAQLRRCDRTVMDAVTDYLREIYKHTMDTLTRRYGETFMAQTRVEFVLTVPAVWSDAAKHATLLAAEHAGMGDRHSLRLISEPEAAAVYTFKALQPKFLQVGDNFIVCDAGGGTVDLIAYRITQLSPLRVEESAVGTGGLCGSAFLNYRFEDHVRARIGEERYNHMREKKPKTWQTGLKYFEEFVKRNYTEEDRQEINVPFPGLPDDEEAGLDSGFLTMTPEQVKAIFDPVVNQVIELVQGQVSTIRKKGGKVSGIVLVGGFGQSNYLYGRLKRHFNAPAPAHQTGNPNTPQHIEVMQPMYAWTAVVRGAVQRGLEGSIVVSRRSRLHYGTSYATVFDEAVHPMSTRYWSPLWERWMACDLMQWHLGKDQLVSETHAVSFPYTRNFRSGQSLIVTDEVLACAADDAPVAFQPGLLLPVCTLTTDLGQVPRSLFTRLTTTRGIEFDNLDFTLDMRVDSASLVFELRVDGVKYGRVTADFH